MSKLVPFRMPSGWAVIINHFADEDPVIQDGRIVNDQYFSEDVLSIETICFEGGRWVNDLRGHTIDLGWKPEFDPNGRYRLVLLRGDWDNVLVEFESKDRHVIRIAIERMMEMVTQGVDDQEISSLLMKELSDLTRQASGNDEG